MIDYPVRLTPDLQIVDRFGRTVVPDLTWKGDFSHRKQQMEVGELIVKLLNDNSQNDGEEDEALLPAITHRNGNHEGPVKKGRGRPPKS